MESTNPLILNAEHHYALDQIEHLKGAIFLTGKAGTGKSTLIQLFRKTSAKRVIFLAPTGVAAVQIKGQTIHSFFRFPPQWISSKDHRPIPRKLLEKTELIFIDEISMVRADLLDHIDQVLQLSMGNKKVFGGIPMLWTGDLFQLPPVVRADQEQNFLQSLYASPYFFSSKAFEKLEDFELLELHQVFRQSEKYFISLLDKIRMNEADYDDLAAINAQLDPREKDQDEDVRINLTSTNMASNQINSRRLEQLNSPAKIYPAIISGQVHPSQYPADQHLILKEGSQVMFLRNDPMKRFVNGTLGLVQSLQPHSISIQLEQSGQLIELEPFEWEIVRYSPSSGKTQEWLPEVIGRYSQYPLKLAWAITIHKSQGQTFEKVHIDLGRGAFEHGQVYVALSRSKTLEGITLGQPIGWKDIRTDPRVIDFMSRYR